VVREKLVGWWLVPEGSLNPQNQPGVAGPVSGINRHFLRRATPMTTNTKISAGEVVVITRGEHSYYRIEGYVVAKTDFDMQSAIDVFKSQSQRDDDDDQYAKFIAWLVINEKAVPVEHREIHIGSYGSLELGTG
jgi:hypothetical protein